MKLILRCLLALLLPCGSISGADLTAIGSWVLTVNGSHLTSGAGSDLPTQFESIAGVTSLNISNALGAWTLRTRLGGIGGHGDVSIFVRRVSAGSGAGGIAGGNGYVEITATDTELFTGSEARSGISLQFKLTGLSDHVAPATYLSSVIFSVQ